VLVYFFPSNLQSRPLRCQELGRRKRKSAERGKFVARRPDAFPGADSVRGFRPHSFRAPPVLIPWGKRDLKTLEYQLLDAGHFALESNSDEIAGLMQGFLDKHMRGK